MRGKLFIILFMIPLLVNAASIKLINDTEYDLTAILRGKSGVLLGEIFVKSFYTEEWTYNASLYETPPKGGINDFTPITVNWMCMGGKVYAVCENAIPGMEITANECEGSHWCEPKIEPPQY